MGNGTETPPLEWLIAGFIGIGTAVFGFWNKVLHGRLNRHDEELKRHGEQLAAMRQSSQNQEDTGKEIKASVRGLHKRLDDLVQHGCKRGAERHGP